MTMDTLGLQVSMSWKDVKRSTVNGNGKRTVWKYAQADFTKACSLIEATNWESLLTGDVNQALANWEAKYIYGNYGTMYSEDISPKAEKSAMADKGAD